MKLIATLITASLMSVSASAADLGVRVDEVHTALNKFFRSIKNDQRALRQTCESGASGAMCSYMIGSYVAVLATAEGPKRPANTITMIYSSQRTLDAAKAMLAYAALVGVLNPSTPKEDRGDLILQLVGALKTGDRHQGELDQVRYTISRTEGMGLWFTAAPVN